MNDLLAGYQTVKGAGSGKKTPIVKITSLVGAVLKGVLLSKKSFKDDEGKERLIATFRLIETTAPMILKGAAGYAPVTDVPAGSDVTIYGAPTRLERALANVEDGGVNEVLIVYEGKKKEVVNGRSVFPHIFKVGKKTAEVVAAAPTEQVPD